MDNIKKASPLFAHRPPSVGVHLLSDPFPEHLLPPASLASGNTDRAAAKVLTKSAKTRKSR